MQHKFALQFSNQYIKVPWSYSYESRVVRKFRIMDKTINYQTALHVLKVMTKKLSNAMYLLTQEGLLSIPAKNHYHMFKSLL